MFKDQREVPLYLLSDGTSREMTALEIQDATNCIAEYDDFCAQGKVVEIIAPS